MVTIARPAQRLTLPVPVAGAIASGGLVAIGFLLVPSGILERVVSASGIPAVLAAAEPPLGITARIALGLVFGGLVAAFAWVGLHLTAAERPFDFDRLTAWMKRGDAHPDAPPRQPLFAHRDLGTPFLDVKAPVATAESLDLSSPIERASPKAVVLDLPPPIERDLPADLDLPLASFDPAAIPATPIARPEPVEPLAPALAPARPQLIDPGDRFETFELTPVQRATPISLRAPAADDAPTVAQDAPEPARVVAPDTESTVHALLARLELGIAHRAATAPASTPVPTGSLQDTLGDLRRLATGGH